MFAIAINLRGYFGEELLVFIERAEGRFAFVRTVDGRDPGRPLVVEAHKLRPANALWKNPVKIW